MSERERAIRIYTQAIGIRDAVAGDIASVEIPGGMRLDEYCGHDGLLMVVDAVFSAIYKDSVIVPLSPVESLLAEDSDGKVTPGVIIADRMGEALTFMREEYRTRRRKANAGEPLGDRFISEYTREIAVYKAIVAAFYPWAI